MNKHVEEAHIAPHVEIDRSKRRRRPIVGSIVALILLAGLGWLAWHLTHPDKNADAPRPGGSRGGPPATTVGVATAEKADIPVVLEALGTVTAPATVTVRPQVSGVLQKVLFSEGEMVKAGQLLATIDPRPFEMALMQASGQRQRDEAQLENAKLTLQRFRKLLEQDSIARQEVDTQTALVKQLEGTVMTDKAAEGTARLNLSYARIAAPIGGRVGLRAVDAGNIVNTGDANGIAVITQVSPIDVQFAIPQDRVPELRERLNEDTKPPVIALDRARSSTLDSGRFLELDNQVDTQTGTVRAKARFANDKMALFPSQFVNVRLEMRTVKDAVMVPVTALRHGSNGDFVYVLNGADKTVALRPVKRGQATIDKVEIVSGLRAGEKVITEGADRLKDGSRVTLPGDKPGAGANGNRRKGERGARPDAPPGAPTPGISTSASEGAASAPPGERRRRPAEAAAQ